ncbi:MAG TPA: hypothetical protein VMX94_04950 [Armatimonadota bacterium]|nr:hypothetical protein [Armatimonadota bacterium]
MKFRSYVVLGAAIAALMIGFAPASATEFRGDIAVVVDEGTTVNDELYASGQNVAINGSVTGDLLAAGSKVSLRGKAGESASLMGGDIDVSGSVGGNLRAAGGQVTISGTVADNASVAGGMVDLTKTARVGRDLQAASGDLRIEGNVGRDLRAAGGNVTINGKIGRNARIDGGQLTLGPSSLIQGDLTYTSSQKASIAPGARILGKTTYHAAPPRAKPAAPGWRFGLWLISFLALFAVGATVIAVAPATAASAADKVISAPWISLLVGFILLVVVPVAVAIVAATLIGIPLALILLAMYVIMIYLSRLFVGLAIGRWLFARFGRPQMSLYVDLLVGLAILWLLVLIPRAGWFIHLIAIFLGLGALAAQRYAVMRQLRAEGRI